MVGKQGFGQHGQGGLSGCPELLVQGYLGVLEGRLHCAQEEEVLLLFQSRLKPLGSEKRRL